MSRQAYPCKPSTFSTLRVVESRTTRYWPNKEPRKRLPQSHQVARCFQQLVRKGNGHGFDPLGQRDAPGFITGAPQPNAYALIIGIEDYRDVAPTPGARADAEPQRYSGGDRLDGAQRLWGRPNLFLLQRPWVAQRRDGPVLPIAL